MVVLNLSQGIHFVSNISSRSNTHTMEMIAVHLRAADPIFTMSDNNNMYEPFPLLRGRRNGFMQTPAQESLRCCTMDPCPILCHACTPRPRPPDYFTLSSTAPSERASQKKCAPRPKEKRLGRSERCPLRRALALLALASILLLVHRGNWSKPCARQRSALFSSPRPEH
jgi:hypothetical protein